MLMAYEAPSSLALPTPTHSVRLGQLVELIRTEPSGIPSAGLDGVFNGAPQVPSTSDRMNV
jgi:hypothetical protein